MHRLLRPCPLHRENGGGPRRQGSLAELARRGCRWGGAIDALWVNGPVSPEFSLRPSQTSDAAWIAELRAVVMRPDLERLARWDPVRVRERFLNGFQPELSLIHI